MRRVSGSHDGAKWQVVGGMSLLLTGVQTSALSQALVYCNIKDALPFYTPSPIIITIIIII